MLKVNRWLSIAAVATLGFGCGTGGGSPDASTPQDVQRTGDASRVIEMPGDPTTDPLPETDQGSFNEGTDSIGSCTGYSNTLMIGPDGAKVCIDYNEGTAADAMMDCMGRGSGGTFRAGQACDQTTTYLVANCSKTGPAVTAYFYRQSATRTNPDPVNVTAEDVGNWCSANSWMSTAPTTPTNTGRCSYRTTSNWLNISSPAISVCINYDRGYTAAEAQTDCSGVDKGTWTGTPALSLGESCPGGAATQSCEVTVNGKTYSFRYSWGYRSTQPWSEMEFADACAQAGGMLKTGI